MQKGSRHSEDSKKKIAATHTGKRHSTESRNKQGYWKGKHLTEEHKHKLSISNRGRKRTQETRDRISQAMTGRRHTGKARKMMSIAQQKRFRQAQQQATLKKLITS